MFASGEFLKICASLKADLLKDLDACAMFVDSIGKEDCSDLFANRPTS